MSGSNDFSVFEEQFEAAVVGEAGFFHGPHCTEHEWVVEVFRRRSWRHPFRRTRRWQSCVNCGVLNLGIVRR